MSRNLKAAFVSLAFMGLFAVFLFFKLRMSKDSFMSGFKPVRPELILSTYQSWITEGSLGAEIIPLFEAQTHCKIRVMTAPEGGSVLSRLEWDWKRPHAVRPHVVLGVDQSLWSRALPYVAEWGDQDPLGYADLPATYRIEKNFLPYAVSTLGFMSDLDVFKSQGLQPPHSLLDLLQPQWRRQLLLEDPRTSTPGLVFLLYTFEVLGEKQAFKFWQFLREQWLTLPASWTAAYSLFLRKQAPLVWTYFSSQAYHQKEKQVQYQMLRFREGQPHQIEGAFLVKDSGANEQQRALSRKFLEFLLSTEVQEKIPDRSWMFPVKKEVKLPPEYEGLPHPLSVPQVRLTNDARVIQKVLNLWREAVGAGR